MQIPEQYKQILKLLDQRTQLGEVMWKESSRKEVVVPFETCLLTMFFQAEIRGPAYIWVPVGSKDHVRH